jgi:hypothetical protein
MSSPSSVTPPPVVVRTAGVQGASVEVQALGDRAGAHVDVVDVLEAADGDSKLFLGLTADRGLGVLVVKQARGSLDEPPVGVIVDIGGVPELTG